MCSWCHSLLKLCWYVIENEWYISLYMLKEHVMKSITLSSSKKMFRLKHALLCFYTVQRCSICFLIVFRINGRNMQRAMTRLNYLNTWASWHWTPSYSVRLAAKATVRQRGEFMSVCLQFQLLIPFLLQFKIKSQI